LASWLWTLPRLVSVDASASGLTGDLPSFVRKTTLFQPYEDRTGTLCPILDSDGVQVAVSPDFYHFLGCICTNGLAGRNGNCYDCPIGAVCDNGAEMLVQPEFWCNSQVYMSGSGGVLAMSSGLLLCGVGRCVQAGGTVYSGAARSTVW